MPEESQQSESGQPAADEKKIKSPKLVEQLFNPQLAPPKPEVEYWTLAVHRLILLVAVATFIVATVAAIYGILLYQNEQEKNRSEAHNDAEKIQNALNIPTIKSPPNGATVDTKGKVEGYIPYKGKKVYLLVTAAENNTEYVQDEASVDSLGNWSANATYGSSSTELPANFYIRIIITEKNMNVNDENPELPSDKIITSSIMVTRINKYKQIKTN